jgi:hypothetical protein
METDMPAKTKTSASKTLLPGRSPTHRLYRVQGDGEAAIWTPIGAAWPNKDGKGFNLSCDAVPLTGRLVLRSIEPRASGGQQ